MALAASEPELELELELEAQATTGSAPAVGVPSVRLDPISQLSTQASSYKASSSTSEMSASGGHSPNSRCFD